MNLYRSGYVSFHGSWNLQFHEPTKVNQVFPTQPVVQSVQLLQAPPAESLNFHMKLSNTRSHDSKCDKIAVKVNYPQNVKSMKNQEVLDFGKNGFYRSKHNLMYFWIKYKTKRISQMSKSRKLVGKSPIFFDILFKNCAEKNLVHDLNYGLSVMEISRG